MGFYNKISLNDYLHSGPENFKSLDQKNSQNKKQWIPWNWFISFHEFFGWDFFKIYFLAQYELYKKLWFIMYDL